MYTCKGETERGLIGWPAIATPSRLVDLIIVQLMKIIIDHLSV